MRRRSGGKHRARGDAVRCGRQPRTSRSLLENGVDSIGRGNANSKSNCRNFKVSDSSAKSESKNKTGQAYLGLMNTALETDRPGKALWGQAIKGSVASTA
jgi:hypothetical protein